MALLPKYFYDINGIMPDGRQRWHDTCASIRKSECIEHPMSKDPGFLVYEYKRNKSYELWLSSFIVERDGKPAPLITPKQIKFQAIRVLSANHSERTKQDWWERYQDACFRVFLQPETIYDKYSNDHKQWYVLSPEDCYTVNQYELSRLTPHVPLREYNGHERFISSYPQLRQIRLIPVECCAHMRHETTAGVLPEGL